MATGMSDRKSKRKPAVGADSDLAIEYDFSKGVRGKYSHRFAAGRMIVHSMKKASRAKGNRG